MKRISISILLFLLLTSCKKDPRNIIVKDLKTPCECVEAMNEIYKEMVVLRDGKDLETFLLVNRKDYNDFLILHEKATQIKDLTSIRNYSETELQVCPDLMEMMDNYRRAED